jgi:hypothetical protein
MNGLILSAPFILILSLGSVVAQTPTSRTAKEEFPQKLTVSIVDYLATKGRESNFEERKKLFAKHIDKDAPYTGSAHQNTQLLAKLLEQDKENKLVPVPTPSASTKVCAEFYNDPAISKKLTEAFKSNAIKACAVTGDAELQQKIRKRLQELYIANGPSKGKVFTAKEHKAIHDQAYKEAGCKEESAGLLGWILVDSVSISDPVGAAIIEGAIKHFGPCNATEAKAPQDADEDKGRRPRKQQ